MSELLSHFKARDSYGFPFVINEVSKNNFKLGM